MHAILKFTKRRKVSGNVVTGSAGQLPGELRIDSLSGML